ncbi:MAG: hypothetical protein D6B27_04755 [Gammaproteobacteria bacterium]|nr:MAG: hypothetical protein D6B27_04755 [Gammaproteobacteria bacterium]
MKKFSVLILLFIISNFASADQKNFKHNTSSKQNSNIEAFSFSGAMKSLKFINESLESYRKITEDAASQKPIIVSNYKHTDKESQNRRLDSAITAIELIVKQQKQLNIRVVPKFKEKLNAEDLSFQDINHEESTYALQLIKESITSFKKITKDAIAAKPITLKKYKHTNWEIQNIGFINALLKIEGAIRQQEYFLKKLKYESAKSNKQSLKKDFAKAKKQYSDFINRTRRAD